MPMEGVAEESVYSAEFLDIVKQELLPMIAQLDRLETGQQSLATKVDVMATGVGRIYGFGNGFGNGSTEIESPPPLRPSPASPSQAPAAPPKTPSKEPARRRSMRAGLLLTDQWQTEPEIVSPTAEPAVLAERETITVGRIEATPEPVEQAEEDKELDSPTKRTQFQEFRGQSVRSCASSTQSEPMSPSIKATKLKESQKLLEIFLAAEEEEERLVTTEVQAQGRGSSILGMRRHRHRLAAFASKESFARWLDSWMGLIISANAVFIGISVDNEPPDGNAEPGWLVANLVFCTIFWIELVLKLSLHGFRQHFGGSDRIMNWFDFCLVVVDTLQLGLAFIMPAIAERLGDKGLPSPSLFRVLRLLRLLRLVRLSRSEAAKDLVSMLTGLLGGARTLLWATALFIVVMYIIALIFQEALRAARDSAGDPDGVDIRQFFSDTPRSMFTVFRCSFGDCSDRSGTPIVEHMKDNFGVATSLFFSLFLFFVVIGLFNVISAIFVESTLSAAAKMQRDNKERRLSNETLFASEVSRMMKLLLEPHDRRISESSNNIGSTKLSERMDEVMALELPCSTINQMVNDPFDGRFRVALTKLDIDPGDHRHLSSILDPDGSGKIDSVEFVSGVERLRGEPRRSDVVSVQLMIRSLQDQVEEDKTEMKEMVESIKQEVSEIARALDHLRQGQGAILRHAHHAAHHAHAAHTAAHNGSAAPPLHHYESAQERRRHQFQVHDDRSLSTTMLM